MLPVTITLGLINVNTLIGTLFASRLLDPELAPAAIDKAFRLYMLPQGMFSVAVATVLFPALSRLAARDDMPAFSPHARHRPAPDRLPPDSGRRDLRRARRADRPPRLPARRVHLGADAGRRGRARRLLARPRLQRVDADAQPRVLRPPVELAADARRARQPRAQHRPDLLALPLRRLGDPARDLAREPGRRGGVAPAHPAASAAPAAARDGRSDRPHGGRRRRARGRVVSQPGTRSTRCSVARSGRSSSPSARASSAARSPTSPSAGCSVCGSCAHCGELRRRRD